MGTHGQRRQGHVRFAHQLITIVWGAVYVAELFVRVILIYTLSTPLVLVISSILIGGATVSTIIWTFRYVRRVRARVASDLATQAD